MVSWPAVPLLKPFRALRYDVGAAGPLDDLVSPPYDVVTAEAEERLLARSPWNAVRIVRPEPPEDAARALADWQDRGILVREERPAVWLLEEEFTGPDGVRRTRRGFAARVRLERYRAGVVLPHEHTFAEPKEARLRLFRAARTKPSPIFLLHHGTAPAPEGEPDLGATLDGVVSRLWRVDDPAAIAGVLARVEGPLLIADGHHRYETALRFHEEDGSEETGHVLAVLVGKDDDGLEIFPTHRLTAGAVPELDGRFRVTALGGPSSSSSPGGQRSSRRSRPGSTRPSWTPSRWSASATRRARRTRGAPWRAARRRRRSSSARRPWSRWKPPPGRASACRRRAPISSRS
jgi:uncharacterized protein (DUF1015 family)